MPLDATHSGHATAGRSFGSGRALPHIDLKALDRDPRVNRRPQARPATTTTTTADGSKPSERPTARRRRPQGAYDKRRAFLEGAVGKAPLAFLVIAAAAVLVATFAT